MSCGKVSELLGSCREVSYVGAEVLSDAFWEVMRLWDREGGKVLLVLRGSGDCLKRSGCDVVVAIASYEEGRLRCHRAVKIGMVKR